MEREAEQGTPRKVGGAERRGLGERYQRKGSGSDVKEKTSHLSIPSQSTKHRHRKVSETYITPFSRLGAGD